MRKLLSIVISVVVILAMIPVTAFASNHPSDVDEMGGMGNGCNVLSDTITVEYGNEYTYSFEAPFDGVLSTYAVGKYAVIEIPELNHQHTIYKDYYEEEFDPDADEKVADTYVEKGKKYEVKVYTYDDYRPIELEFYVNVYPINPVPITEISMPYRNTTVAKGKKVTTSCFFEPYYATEGVTYKSSNTKIATVSQSGKVTGKKLGRVKITAKVNGRSLSSSCTVTVNQMDYNMWTSEKGKSLQSYVSHISGYKYGKWSSSNKSVVKVSSKGVLTPVKSGKAVVTVKIKGVKYKFNVYTYSKTAMKKKARNALYLLTYWPDRLDVIETRYSVAKDRSGLMLTLYFETHDGGAYSNGVFGYICENKKYTPVFLK